GRGRGRGRGSGRGRGGADGGVGRWSGTAGSGSVGSGSVGSGSVGVGHGHVGQPTCAPGRVRRGTARYGAVRRVGRGTARSVFAARSLARGGRPGVACGGVRSRGMASNSSGSRFPMSAVARGATGRGAVVIPVGRGPGCRQDAGGGGGVADAGTGLGVGVRAQVQARVQLLAGCGFGPTTGVCAGVSTGRGCAPATAGWAGPPPE